ncbi:nuclear receptor subfamily 1 group D member 2-like [Ptychodera flava]|uniref:nuclear receptor subfamily 1 group D member 2-like n=1 Tax=Ptychodera flava TaxID=63121 RepID=UPI00396A01A8
MMASSITTSQVPQSQTASYNTDVTNAGSSGCGKLTPCDGSAAKAPEKPDEPCQVCGDQSSGYHLGAYACEACKKFFIRSTKPDQSGQCVEYACPKDKSCVINKQTRTQCQYCRFQKCLSVGMARKGARTAESESSPIYAKILCQVCGAESSGFHFGAVTCEGCKGFFRRTIKAGGGDRYVCQSDRDCTIKSSTRNTCRYCRYKKCLSVGMSIEGSRIGRQPIHIKRQLLKGNVNFGQPRKRPHEVLGAESKMEAEEGEAKLVEPGNSELSEDCKPSVPVDDDTADQQHNKTKRLKETVATANESDNAKSISELLIPATGSRKNSTENHTSPEHTRTNNCNCQKLSQCKPLKDALLESLPDPDEDETTSPSILMMATRSSPQTVQLQTNTTNNVQLYTQDTASLQKAMTKGQCLQKSCASSLTRTQPWKPHVPSQTGITACQSCDSQCSANQTEAIMRQYHHDRHTQPTYSAKHSGRHRHRRTGPRRPYPNTSKLHTCSLHSTLSCPTQIMGHLAQHTPTATRHQHSKCYESPKCCDSGDYKGVPSMKDTEAMQFNYENSDDACDADSDDITEELLFRMQPTNQQEQYKYVREYTWETRHKLLTRPEESSTNYEQDTHQQLNRDFSMGSFITASRPTTPKIHCPKASVVQSKAAFSDPQLTSFVHSIVSAAQELEPIRCESPSIPRLASGCMTSNTLWEKIMNLFSKHIHCVLRFSKKLPGFRSCQLEDQITMVQNAVFQIVMVVLAKDYNKTEMRYNYFSMSREETEKVKLLFPQIGVLSSDMEIFEEALSLLNLDDVENALLIAIQLTATDWPGLKNTSPIGKIQDKICLALEEYCQHRGSDGYDHFGKILMMTPRLRRLANIYHKCVLRLRREMPHLDFTQLWNEVVYIDDN